MYEQASAAGLSVATGMLEQCHYYGVGTEVAYDKASRAFHVAVNQGNAMYLRCVSETVYVRPDAQQQRAIKIYGALAEMGSAMAQYAYLFYCSVSCVFLEEGDASHDNLNFIFFCLVLLLTFRAFYGNYLLSGIGVTKNVTKAVEMYEMAVASDYTTAMLSLAGMLEKGEDLKRDMKRAEKLR